MILKEAKRLYDLGFAVHWIKSGSKAPVKSGWSGPTRDDWSVVEKDYVKGYGLGVRLGESSKVGGGYLANIDVDIKSSERRHKTEARTYIGKHFPGLLTHAPIVETSYGLRIFVRTKTPLPSGKLTSSNEDTVVFMPTAEVNKRQLKAVGEGKITQEQLDAGFRVRPAWEVEFMSTGKQVVLPPSIHPETKNPYVWWKEVGSADDLPFVDEAGLPKSTKRTVNGGYKILDFKPVVVDLVMSPLSDRVVDMIVHGEGVEDRSAACFGVTIAMLRAGYSDDQILSVLTDRSTVLGETAYDHRKTEDRLVAAAWVRDYCLKKAKTEIDAARVFEDSVSVSVVLEDDAAVAAQLMELTGGLDLEGMEGGGDAWKGKLRRGGKDGDGALKATLHNVLLILIGTYGSKLFKRDTFSGYNVFGVEVPWGGKIDEEFKNDHQPQLRAWLGEKWNIEPIPSVLHDAMIVIALKNPFHPLQDYLKSLTWDGVPRIDTWLKTYLNAHDVRERYLASVSRIVLIALVARAFEPGCKFDYMLILKGKQGIKKSTALNILVGDKYFSSTVLHVGEKDTVLKMKNKWLIEFGELSTLKADVRALKNFITTKSDRERLPYDKYAEDFGRSCILAGSTNQDDFLSDETGDRRFWPVSVGEVDTEAITRDRDQLFAEALMLYELGEPLYLDKETEAEAQMEQARWRPAEDTMVEKIRETLELNALRSETELNRFPPNGFSLHEIMKDTTTKDDIQTQRRVGAALKANGYKQKPSRMRGKLRKLWFKDVTDA